MPLHRPGDGAPSFIVVDGRIAAVRVWSERYRTPSGIRIGSTIAEVRRTYPGQIHQEPNVYSDEPVLTFIPRDPANRRYRMVFLTENGRVTLIKAGTEPAVHFVEGCL